MFQTANELWILALSSGWVVPLFRDEVVYIHAYVQTFFESIKGYGKKVRSLNNKTNLRVVNGQNPDFWSSRFKYEPRAFILVSNNLSGCLKSRHSEIREAQISGQTEVQILNYFLCNLFFGWPRPFQIMEKDCYFQICLG